MRDFINIITEAMNDSVFDDASQLVATANITTMRNLYNDYSSTDEEIVQMWLDNLKIIHDRFATLSSISIYRNMKVGDVSEYIDDLNSGNATLGEHWSLHPIESPSWEQDHHGEVDIDMVGKISPSQINWPQTIAQNMEWPEEMEPVFAGEVFLQTIEDRDEDNTYTINRSFPR